MQEAKDREGGFEHFTRSKTQADAQHQDESWSKVSSPNTWAFQAQDAGLRSMSKTADADADATVLLCIDICQQ